MTSRRIGLCLVAAVPLVLPVLLLRGVAGARRQGPPAMERPGPRADQPAEASAFAVLKRSPDRLTPVPWERYLAAWAAARKLPVHSTRTGLVSPSLDSLESTGRPLGSLGTWEPLGPGNVGGRTRAILIHPTTPTTMWSAGVAGGVWRSVNGGATWAPVSDLLANLAVSSLALDPNAPDVLYAGTGEGFFNGDAVRGAGIFKSTDGGTSWSRLAATAGSGFYYVNRIVVSKGSSSRVYAATRDGVQRSLDGGATWSPVLAPGVSGGCLDLAMRTDQGANDVVLASCGNFAQATIYRNLDADGVGTWSPVYTEGNMGRTSLAIAPSNQSIVYAMIAQRSTSPFSSFQDGLLAVIRSTDGGGTWSDRRRNDGVASTIGNLLMTNPVYANLVGCGFGNSNAFLNQGWYDNVLAVDPVDPNRVWAGGVDLFRSSDGGATWGLASYWWFTQGSDPQYEHADNHAIVFHPGYDGAANQTLYVGSDGGLVRTDNAVSGSTSTDTCGNSPGSISFTSLNNGYEVTQFYHGVAYPGGATYFGGTQDNGTVRGSTASGRNGWTAVRGGDGGYVAVDPTNTSILFAENTGMSIQKSTNGGTSWVSATTGISGDAYLFINPFVMDPGPGGSSRLWTGGNRVWRTTNGATSWQQAAGTLGANVSALAVSPVNPNRILAGTTVGKIARTATGLTDSAAVWASTTPASGYVSWLAFAPASDTVAYATYSTFGVGHVFKSTNSGATWSNISGDLPDAPVHSIAVDPTNPSRLYVGTDIGVFSSTNGGTGWMVENTGFANVITESLAVDGARLLAFTHGRGTWRVSLAPAGAGASFYTLAPCRVVDTRGTNGPLGGPALVAGASRSFPIVGTCGVPAGAASVAANLTVTQPSTAGDLRVYPSGGTLPATSVINFGPGQTRANNGILLLGGDGQVAVQCDMAGGSTHLILDVVGYFQ